MAFRIEQTDQAIRDKELIFDFLVESYQNFGEDDRSAASRTAKRVSSIEDSINTLARAPNQGTLHPTFAPNMRSVTKSRVILWFTVDKPRQRILILGIFFGGQDQQRKMLTRLLSNN